VTEAFTRAFNHVCQVGWRDSDTNGVSLHHKTYRDCRDMFGLPAQLACTARVKATEALLSVKDRIRKGKKASCPRSRLCPIRLDARTYSVRFDKGEASIVTLGKNKRHKCAFRVREHYKPLLGWKQASADLVLDRDRVWLHLVMQKEVADPVATGRVVGMDAGIKRAAVVSTNQFYGGGKLSHVAWKYRRARRLYQKAGHVGKRHLRRLGRRENRFANDMLHCISKRIVAGLRPGDAIAMEDLRGIREHGLRKAQRTALNAWAFSRLQGMIQYKAEAAGHLVARVEARNTSRTCSRCGHCERSNRKGQSLFQCKHCHHPLNADLNASRNIARKGEMLVATCHGHGLPSTSLLSRRSLAAAASPRL
jgi:IS605 OrfB family transposase